MSGGIAFLILAHGYPRQLRRFLERLGDPRFRFFVHLDRKTPRAEYLAALGDLPEGVTFLRRRHTIHWGGYRMVEATVALMEAALADPTPYDYYSLHSELDLPIRPAPEIADRLLGGKDCFLDAFPLRKDVSDRKYLNRLRKLAWMDHPYLNVRTLQKIDSPRQRAAYRAYKRLRRLRGKRWPPAPFAPYYGSQWWTLPHDAAAHVAGAFRRHRALRRFFRFTACPDEMVVQTLLLNSPLRDRCRIGPPTARVDDGRHHLRYVDWDEARESPAILDERDFPALAASDALFARKLYGARSARLVEAIDRELLGFGDGGGRSRARAV